ncbi:hypothetical protein HMPREF0495_01881 [Levilactobacillus brevis ATCC 14869 = DSM 20054]|uniref:Uncharacterized protein n=2 Tax=Levilactobacillus brevis TaxID=1580 RepID=U2NW89_LEVBR|nr:hypothetical protein HMPREF0495_01881 [Levilactobacillus brevis ATCC 14869 = DSM 20054]KID41841.1 hypothetical protein LbDm2_2559 [Levilactobacillus brevis]BAN06997.1 hypothetical protein LVISKB_1362 [Levilactobacillus brevis KB290]KIO93688.1 hypothetical protein N627_2314 [Levilactobacillus brevis]KIO95552.1 hypothetical protein N624_1666 [Levilactobacillus brevis]
MVKKVFQKGLHPGFFGDNVIALINGFLKNLNFQRREIKAVR